MNPLAAFLFSIIFCCSLSASAYACLAQPPEQYAPANELIKRTENIVLATVTAARWVDTNKEYGNEIKKIWDTPHKERTQEQNRLFYSLSGKETAEYTFNTIEILKGSAEPQFNFIGKMSDPNSHINSFDDHKNTLFYDNPENLPFISGRAYHDASCAIKPSFVLGYTYLLFLDGPRHQKGFEVILNPEQDKWLAYVREKVKEDNE